ncbi:MAG: hypothetical protein PVF29_03585 [Desulfobacterales bacterium]
MGKFMTFCKKVLKLSAIIILMGVLACCGKPDTASRAPQKIDPLLFKTATELTGTIRRVEITCLDLLNRHIANIQANNDRINAVVAMERRTIPGMCPERPAVHRTAQPPPLLRGST